MWTNRSAEQIALFSLCFVFYRKYYKITIKCGLNQGERYQNI